ncbi:MAG: hypothetical protein JXA41_16390 [Deltaproteobacteria bacterium]|nr:hypothetical protein [Deltaproteobacteria bacterium]
MITVRDLEQQIRNFINHPRKQYVLLQDKAAWNMLCSCLDLIGDTELAIAAYGQNQSLEDVGGKYLLVYGILQTLFLQQDAVRNLCEALNIEYAADPVLEQIRKIRNDSIGHPTKRGNGKGKAFSFISRTSLSKYGFDLMTTYPDGRSPLFQHINILSLIENQKQILTQVLTEVLKQLKKEEAEHKAMFKSDHVQDAFPNVLHYYFEKLYETIHGSKPEEFGTIHINLIAETLNNFKIKLENRGILKAYDSVGYLLELLEYPIAQLSAYFVQPDAPTIDKKTAYIFAFFVEKHVEELIGIAKEIDEKYDAEDPEST